MIFRIASLSLAYALSMSSAAAQFAPLFEPDQNTAVGVVVPLELPAASSYALLVSGCGGGGGGAGGSGQGGGGGGGGGGTAGYATTVMLPSNTRIAVILGAGGAGRGQTGNNGIAGDSGGTSSLVRMIDEKRYEPLLSFQGAPGGLPGKPGTPGLNPAPGGAGGKGVDRGGSGGEGSQGFYSDVGPHPDLYRAGNGSINDIDDPKTWPSGIGGKGSKTGYASGGGGGGGGGGRGKGGDGATVTPDDKNVSAGQGELCSGGGGGHGWNNNVVNEMGGNGGRGDVRVWILTLGK